GKNSCLNVSMGPCNLDPCVFFMMRGCLRNTSLRWDYKSNLLFSRRRALVLGSTIEFRSCPHVSTGASSVSKAHVGAGQRLQIVWPTAGPLSDRPHGACGPDDRAHRPQWLWQINTDPPHDRPAPAGYRVRSFRGHPAYFG